jgi:hypothetical protein
MQFEKGGIVRTWGFCRALRIFSEMTAISGADQSRAALLLLTASNLGFSMHRSCDVSKLY